MECFHRESNRLNMRNTVDNSTSFFIWNKVIKIVHYYVVSFGDMQNEKKNLFVISVILYCYFNI